MMHFKPQVKRSKQGEIFVNWKDLETIQLMEISIFRELIPTGK